MTRSVGAAALMGFFVCLAMPQLGCRHDADQPTAQQRASIRKGLATSGEAGPRQGMAQGPGGAQQPPPGEPAATTDAPTPPGTEADSGAPPAAEPSEPAGAEPSPSEEKHEDQGGQDGQFAKMDRNRDGVLTADETGPEAMRFLDQNGDGKATHEEVRSARERGQASHGDPFKFGDKNGDGVLTADEIGAGRLKRLDLDKDGKVTKDEARKAMEAMRQERGQQGKAQMEEGFKKLDSNQDGKLSSSEIEQSGQMAPMIQKADANGDGAVTMDELKSAIAHRPGGPNSQKGNR